MVMSSVLIQWNVFLTPRLLGESAAQILSVLPQLRTLNSELASERSWTLEPYVQEIQRN